MEIQELIKVANAANPELIEKAATALQALEKSEPEFAAEVLADFREIGAAVKTGLEKTASAGEYGKAIGVAAGTMAAGGLAAAVASDLYDAARRGLTKGVNFRRMMQAASPELSQFEKDKIRAAFNAIHRFGPEFTADPTTSAALTLAILRSPDLAGNSILSLTGARKNLIEARRKQFASSGMPLNLKADSRKTS